LTFYRQALSEDHQNLHEDAILIIMRKEEEPSFNQSDQEQPYSNIQKELEVLTNPDEISRVKKAIVQQWRSLPRYEQVSLLKEQLSDVIGDERGHSIIHYLTNQNLPIGVDEIVEIDKATVLPVRQVAKLTGYTFIRLRDLLREGKLEGEMREGKIVPSGWYTSVEAVEKYRANLPSRQEQGRRGATKRWQGEK
jgi:hypothetical protein